MIWSSLCNELLFLQHFLRYYISQDSPISSLETSLFADQGRIDLFKGAPLHLLWYIFTIICFLYCSLSPLRIEYIPY